MTRITRKHLNHYLAELNNLTGSPSTYFVETGERVTSIGHYCISGAYGGYQLQRVSNGSGGVRTISAGGHIPARALLGQIQCAIEVARNMKGE